MNIIYGKGYRHTAESCKNVEKGDLRCRRDSLSSKKTGCLENGQ